MDSQYAGYIFAAYSIAALVIGALVLWAVLDARRQKHFLRRLETHSESHADG